MREAAWTEPPGRRGLGGPAELAEAWAAAGEGKGPLQPASRPAGSVPSPGRAVPSPPPHDSALCTPGSHPLTRTQHHSRLHVPHAQLSLVHTMAGRTQGLPDCQGGETRPGTAPCLGPCPLRLLGPQPPHPWSTWTFSRMDVSLEPLLQSGSSLPPLLFFPYCREQPGPHPSESLSSGFPFCGSTAGFNRLLPAGPRVTCSFRFTLDPKNPLPPALWTEQDSRDLGRGRQNGLPGQQD